MKKQLIRMVSVFLIFLSVLTLGSVCFLERRAAADDKAAEIVALNEIAHLSVDESGNPLAADQIRELGKMIENNGSSDSAVTGKSADIWKIAALFFGCGLVFLSVLFFYIYRKILRPFEKLENYAEQIAGGDLSGSLDYERENFFGEFTWAFDHMRQEILYAKRREKEAVQQNKTIIAALSHDIKTPIASIRAYAEGLEANLDSDYETRQRYLEVIQKKSDEVTALVNDLVLHSLSELNKLEIKPEKVRLDQILKETVKNLEFPGITLEEPLPQVLLWADPKRTAQALENLLNNARKYAPGSVEIFAEQEKDRCCIHVKDHGKGILPEDMPFITGKFYRGKNAGDLPGSGLGLYIVSYLMEEMKGGLELHNTENGLDAVIWLPIENS